MNKEQANMRYLLDDLEKTAAPVGPEFYDAVTKGNKRSARIMMKDSMLTDPSMTDYTQMRSKASTMKDLYDQHDGREFVTDKSLWNDDLMNKEMVRIVGNYSPEREKHLQEVVQHLRPQHTQPPSAPKAPIAKKSFAKPLAIGGGLAALGGGAYLYNRYKKKKRAEQEKTALLSDPDNLWKDQNKPPTLLNALKPKKPHGTTGTVPDYVKGTGRKQPSPLTDLINSRKRY